VVRKQYSVEQCVASVMNCNFTEFFSK